MDEDGGVVVVWRSETPADSQSRIFGRRFGPAGAPLGDEFAVSEPTLPVREFSPAIALDGGGRFVAAWIFARRFGATGSPQGRAVRAAPDLSAPALDTRRDGSADLVIPFTFRGAIPLLGNVDGL